MPTKKQKSVIAEPQVSYSPNGGNTSSTQPIVTLMDFYSALRLMEQGYKIRRASWPTQNDYCVMYDGKVHVHRADDGKLHPWIINDGDMAGADWETV